jgi:pimeloyl-ACP methyl ester carboxylesterase
LPNSNLIVLDKTGHLTPEERPEETCRLIQKFIDG